jgi:hypothetical protein
MKFIIEQINETYVVLTINGFEVRVSANEDGLTALICKNDILQTSTEFDWDDQHENA